MKISELIELLNEEEINFNFDKNKDQSNLFCELERKILDYKREGIITLDECIKIFNDYKKEIVLYLVCDTENPNNHQEMVSFPVIFKEPDKPLYLFNNNMIDLIKDIDLKDLLVVDIGARVMPEITSSGSRFYDEFLLKEMGILAIEIVDKNY